MAYISLDQPGVTRGPHEHVDQADLFLFPRSVEFQTADVGQSRRLQQRFVVVKTLIVGAGQSRVSTRSGGRRSCLPECRRG